MISHENESVILLNSEVQKDAAITGHDILPDGDSAGVVSIAAESNGAPTTNSLLQSGDIFIDGSAKTPRLIELEDRIGVTWEEFAQRRLQEGISQHALALEVGVDSKTVRKWNRNLDIKALPSSELQIRSVEVRLQDEGTTIAEQIRAGEANNLPPTSIMRELGLPYFRAREIYDRYGLRFPTQPEIVARQWKNPEYKERRSTALKRVWDELSEEERKTHNSPRTQEALDRKLAGRKKGGVATIRARIKRKRDMRRLQQSLKSSLVGKEELDLPERLIQQFEAAGITSIRILAEKYDTLGLSAEDEKLTQEAVRTYRDNAGIKYY